MSTTTFDPKSTEQIKQLQQHLLDLGYYTSSIDGTIGPNAINAINTVLLHQGSSTQLSSKAKATDITSEIYTFILKIKEKRTDALYRIKQAEILALHNLIKNSSTILTEEQQKKLFELLDLILITDTAYDRNGSYREIGYNAFLDYLKNGASLPEKELTFDCSSFATLYIEIIFGVKCERDKSSGYGPYTTPFYFNDTTNFEHSTPLEEIKISTLKQGQLILFDTDGIDHIVLYCGNGYIAHANASNDKVSIDKLSMDDDYTRKFLSKDVGYFNTAYILTPKIN